MQLPLITTVLTFALSSIAPLYSQSVPAGCHATGSPIQPVVCPDYHDDEQGSGRLMAEFIPVPNPEPVGTGGTGTRFKV